eukprot:TRINITY_DN31626_c0_g1_i1.p1 TRINITY_DN31626_c0_g1~~TRINITY_DN31626_c0_g1_i1.p1  ORF type:complete len:682 (+),score=102.09 TRINITY_DN31626_c0_g1_i1:69-2114(+)
MCLHKSPAPFRAAHAMTLWICWLPLMTYAVVTDQSATPKTIVVKHSCRTSLADQQFNLQGSTASGAPYYKSVNAIFYLYLDPSCDGTSGPQWLIDSEAPSTDAFSKLDGSGECAAYAQLSVPPGNLSLPLGSSVWTESCHDLMSHEMSLSETLQSFTMTGFCKQLRFLNRVTFHAVGTLASGMTYYRQASGAMYIYFDPTCDGTAESAWIIDNHRPSTSAKSMLDGTGQCKYFGNFVASLGTALSEGNSTWEMGCGDAWLRLPLDISGFTKTFRLTGSCQKDLNGVRFQLQGATASGAPYYASEGMARTYYFYFDLNCDASATTPARWLLDDKKPDITKTSMLNGLSRCEFVAYYDAVTFNIEGIGETVQAAVQDELPMGTHSWQMFCASAWQTVKLDLEDKGVGTSIRHSLTTATTTPSMTSTPISSVAGWQPVATHGILQKVHELVNQEFKLGLPTPALVNKFLLAATRPPETARQEQSKPYALITVGPQGAGKRFALRFLAGLPDAPGSIQISDETILRDSSAWRSSVSLCRRCEDCGCSDLYTGYFSAHVEALKEAMLQKAVAEKWHVEIVDDGRDAMRIVRAIDTLLLGGYSIQVVGVFASAESCKTRGLRQQAQTGRMYDPRNRQASMEAIEVVQNQLTLQRERILQHHGAPTVTFIDNTEKPAQSDLTRLKSEL